MAARCPNCKMQLPVSFRYIFSAEPSHPAQPTEMVVRRDGKVVHRCGLPEAEVRT